MSNKKIVITTFLLPNEVDDYERTLINLQRASKYVDGNNYTFFTVLCLSDEVIDWKNSGMDREYFTQRFESLKSLTNWTPNVIFEISDEILGCTTLRRTAVDRFEDATHFIWLDSDMVFHDETLSVFEVSIDGIREMEIENYVLTSETIKMWDNSWDCIVNENYLDKPGNYIHNHNPFVEFGIKGEMGLEVVTTDGINPTFKFGGGWFTCFSRSLLNMIRLPESLGHYFMDDTYLMNAMQLYNMKRGNQILQFKIKNFVICPNHTYVDRRYFSKLVKRFDRRDEAKKIAASNFERELHLFYNSL